MIAVEKVVCGAKRKRNRAIAGLGIRLSAASLEEGMLMPYGICMAKLLMPDESAFSGSQCGLLVIGSLTAESVWSVDIQLIRALKDLLFANCLVVLFWLFNINLRTHFLHRSTVLSHP